jgi:hypothetical protein
MKIDYGMLNEVVSLCGGITNLASHSLVMKIMQNSFIHNSYVSHINIMHWKHIWDMDLLEDAKSMWHSPIHRFVHHLLTHLSMCQTCFQTKHDICVKNVQTYEWTNFTRFSWMIPHVLDLWCDSSYELIRVELFDGWKKQCQQIWSYLDSTH